MAEANAWTHVQFRDLTEVLYNPNSYYQFCAKKVQTEFTFYLQAPGGDPGALAQMGFKHVSSMNNWWPSHRGQTRTLKLWWIKQEDKPNLEKDPERRKWYFNHAGYEYYNPITQHMAASGCGFKIGVPPLPKKTLNAAGFYRFFTVLRLPLEELKPLEQKWMKLNHFRFLDKGKLAQYWVNGWEPKDYTPEMEYAFFKTTPQKWLEHGMRGWAQRGCWG